MEINSYKFDIYATKSPTLGIFKIEDQHVLASLFGLSLKSKPLCLGRLFTKSNSLPIERK